MRSKKERLTVTVDRALVRAGNEAVTSGRSQSLSGWVNLALAERAAKERRLTAMANAVAAYEAKFGEISADELTTQHRSDRQSAIVIRGKSRSAGRKRRRGAA
jgi:metal-responsive CopG/Arc/MetJ family transcriptional regulator